MTARARRERQLWHQAGAAEISLGCHTCPDRSRCGGLKLNPAIFDCLDFCCRKPEDCDRVCPHSRSYVDRVREVGGFDATDLGPLPAIPYAAPDGAVPMIYHASSRHRPLLHAHAALPLYRLFRRDGSFPFNSEEHLRRALLLGNSTSIIASGVAKDKEVERWWDLEVHGRVAAIRKIFSLGVRLVTTPNFSLFTNRPRWDDMHARKRIAIVHHEMVGEGLAAALHVNGRTDADFFWWAEYILAHPEVTHIAYEFTTGTGWGLRMPQHVAWLIDLAKAVGRPLQLIVRGGAPYVAGLVPHFSSIAAIETSSFRKSIARKIAYISADGGRKWRDVPLPIGTPVDALLAHNVHTNQNWFLRMRGARELAA